MGYVDFAGTTYGDKPRDFSARPVSDGGAVMDRALETIRIRAQQVIRRGPRSLKNMRARVYLANERKLDLIEPGLSQLDPSRMVLRCEAAVERAKRGSSLVQIVPVQLINARGALLAARWMRRFGERADAFREAAE